MNGRKAKLLRSLAGVKASDEATRKYIPEESTKRTKRMTDALGDMQYEFTTCTWLLAPSARKLYKMLKVGYKERTGLRV